MISFKSLLPLVAMAALLSVACGDEDTNTPNNDNNTNNIEAPTILSTAPLNNEADVFRNRAITATFSESLDPASLVAGSFVLKQGTTTVPTVLTYVESVATLTPVEILDGDTTFTATISTQVKSARGIALASPFSWVFTTTNNTAPTLVSTTPENNATGVSRTEPITATFSEEMDPASFVDNTFVLSQGTGTANVAAVLTYTGLVATLTPDEALNPNTAYTATLTSAVQSVTGFALTNPSSWTFTTLDDVSPQLLSTYPANNDTDVIRNVVVTATFSEAMDPTTLTETSVLLQDGATTIPATLTYSQRIVSIIPDVILDAETVYSVTFTTDVKSALDHPLANPVSWTFTTNLDSLPSMLTTFPANNDINIPRNTLVTVTFSEAMSPVTLNDTSFTFKNGNTDVPGVLSYTGLVATFTPTNVLEADTLYTATVTDEVESLTGYPLQNPSVWSFRTTDSANGPGGVNLGTAEQYVMLAKSAISTTGTSAILGNVGLSPADVTYFTGFSQLMPPTTFTTSAIVTGQMFAADFDAPTPANLTTAVSNMETAYTDAAGRTLPDFTELGAGNIDGMNLVPGLYKWGTSVTIPTGVTLTGSPTDVWIFQIGQNLNVGNAAIVTLAGGAKPENVFWQVAGQITLGTTSQMRGILMCQTLIEVKTGATVHGRLFAQTAITLESNAITQP